MTFYGGDRAKIESWLQKKINYLVGIPESKDSIDTDLQSLVYNFILRKHVGSYDPKIAKALLGLASTFLDKTIEPLLAWSNANPSRRFDIIPNGQQFIEVRINNDQRKAFKTSTSPTYNIYVTFERSHDNLMKVFNGLYDLIINRGYAFADQHLGIPMNFKFLKFPSDYLEDNDHLKFYYYAPQHLDVVERVLESWLHDHRIETVSRPYKHGVDVPGTSWGEMISVRVAKDLENLMIQHKNQFTASQYYDWLIKYLNHTKFDQSFKRTNPFQNSLMLNTSNMDKLQEFRRLGLDIDATSIDLDEPDGTPLEVIRSKATQIGENIIVEDTSLDVDGEDVGVNIKWLLDNIPQFIGKEATFRVLLGIQQDNQIFVFEGSVRGKLVSPKGSGFGFDAYFKPIGSRYTLGESKPDRFNARAIAISNFKNDNPLGVFPLLHWEGIWQKDNPRVPKGVIRDSKGRKIPEKYLAGYEGKRLTERKKEIEQRRDEYKEAIQDYGDEDNFPRATLQKLYRPFKTDQGVKDKRSNYTEEAKRRGFVGSIPNKAYLAGEYYGGKIDPSILKEVNARGMAAWASGGHRPGQTSHSWGIARVNSFLVGGKTFFTADADLAKKLPAKIQKGIKSQRTWK